MPGYDGTGPFAYGPLTGRGLGPCGRGLGFRRGFGRGRGFRFRRAFPLDSIIPVYREEPITKQDEKKLVQEEIRYLEQDLKELRKRLEELK